MTTIDFQSDEDVRAMTAWMAARFEAQCSWSHRYINRTGPWSCVSLADAFRQYSWNDEGWPANKKKLDSCRRRLRAAAKEHDAESAVAVCIEILRWGGVSGRNASYLNAVERRPLNELRHMSTVFLADHTPTSRELLLDPNDPTTECRMNAGFVKIYSILLDYCVIYDGRVGAALGLLVRQFCEDTGRESIPAPLAFAYGVPKEGPNPKRRKRRNPSSGAFRFPILRHDSRFHTEQTMKANWFLRGALALNPAPFTGGEGGFHELAAGLFMVGYDLSAPAA